MKKSKWKLPLIMGTCLMDRPAAVEFQEHSGDGVETKRVPGKSPRDEVETDCDWVETIVKLWSNKSLLEHDFKDSGIDRIKRLKTPS